ncbi:MAG: ABC transporter [Desulfuromonadales bacterium GWD2_61_12]|nr:MAG: ABC transporter [Desulfuromonadales bacterium GWD2_61_12]
MPETLSSLIPLLLPFDAMQAPFMQQALLGLLLLAPLTAAMGVQVVNFRMAFFSDAISHSVFAGVALGLLFALNPQWTTAAFGVVVGLAIMALQRRSSLASDTVIGVFFSAVMAFGLAVVSRERNVARELMRFLYGDILTIDTTSLRWLALLFVVLLLFQFYSYNRLLYIGLNPLLAHAHRIEVARYQYLFAGLLALVVIFAVWAVGVLLVTALLIVPAATARNLARSAGAMFWWALLVSLSSAIVGLLISAQEWARTATGATIILVAFAWFVASTLITLARGRS